MDVCLQARSHICASWPCTLSVPSLDLLKLVSPVLPPARRWDAVTLEAISAAPACTTRTSGFGSALAGSCSLVLRKLAVPPALLATLALVPEAQDPVAGIISKVSLSVTGVGLEKKQ